MNYLWVHTVRRWFCKETETCSHGTNALNLYKDGIEHFI